MAASNLLFMAHGAFCVAEFTVHICLSCGLVITVYSWLELQNGLVSEERKF
jgi:hypothetical protein